jgi:alkanesulfonate monooxygenase SsuD/methylene tetrahydromethanopterin reductase-like flavin-dependent oxidoreductase (luciferase family)
MRFGLSLPNMGEARDLVRLASAAEVSGWDGVFLWDHLHLSRALRLDVVDPWVTLGAMALATERVRLGTLVTPLARRRPWKVAKEVVTLDHLSNGRAVVGVGLGEPPDDDFAAFGDPADPRERAARLDDGLDVLAGLMTGEPFVHEGPRFRVDASFLPVPRQSPRPPIWVAGILPHRKPFARAARWDGVVPLSGEEQLMTPDDVAEVLALTRRGDGFDVVVAPRPGIAPSEFADAGATWLTASAPPWLDGWWDMLEVMAREGPDRG